MELRVKNNSIFGGLVKFYRRLKVRLTSRAFKNKPYLDAYSSRTDALSELDEKMAIGGLWEEMGKRQFEFLVSEGMSHGSRLLDIGCGTLRGGKRFISYLDKGNYYGFDISPGAIQKAQELVEREGLGCKAPDIRVSEAKDLKFRDYRGIKFDFILAQSVFSHLMPDHIEEAFENIGEIMHPTSRFYFTFHIGSEYLRRSNTDFQYPVGFFDDLARKYHFLLVDRSQVYEHPRGQAMYYVTPEG